MKQHTRLQDVKMNLETRVATAAYTAGLAGKTTQIQRIGVTGEGMVEPAAWRYRYNNELYTCTGDRVHSRGGVKLVSC